MSHVKVTSLEQVTQMAAVVALATEQKDEISTQSQVRLLPIRQNVAVVKYICTFFDSFAKEFLVKWSVYYGFSWVHRNLLFIV